MVLSQHDQDFYIKVNGHELMNSRQRESELELARLGCAHLSGCKAPSVLIGGLGLGFTLSEVLGLLGPHGKVLVGELMADVIAWNRKILGKLNGYALRDKRVAIKTGDVIKVIKESEDRFDAILLDIDNGPSAMTDSGNSQLYGRSGILACRRALRERGCLAVWSAEPSKKFEQLLMSCQFHVRRYRVPAYKGSKSLTRFVWVASGSEDILPPGGGEPREPERKKAKRKSSRFRSKR